MTGAQKKIVATWIMSCMVIATCAVFDSWIRENWHNLRWPIFGIILLLASLKGRRGTAYEGQKNAISEIVEEYPWIKLYLVVYCLGIGVGVFYILANHIDLSTNIGFLELFIPIGLLFLPMILVKQREAFLNAGTESNSPLHMDEQARQ